MNMLVNDEKGLRGMKSHLFSSHFHLSLFFLLSFMIEAHRLPLGSQNASKSSLNNAYIPPPSASPSHQTLSLSTSRTQLSSELRPSDATISENDKDSPPKLGEDRMMPKLRKRWMHRQTHEMKEAVAEDREVAPELEEHPGMVGLEIRLEKGLRGSDRLGTFFSLHQLRWLIWHRTWNASFHHCF